MRCAALKKLSLLLALVMIFVCIPTVSIAHTTSVEVASFQTEEDLSYWKVGKYGTTAIKAANKSTDPKYLRSGNYSLTVTNMYNKDIYAFYKKPIDINGNKYAYAWVYYQDSAYNSLAATPALTIHSQTTYSGTNVYPQKTLNAGWNLVEWAIPDKYVNSSLDIIGFYIKKPTVAHETVTLHISSVFLTDTQVTQPSITSSSIKNEATLVKHDVGKMTLSGAGFAPRMLEGGEISIEPAVEHHVEYVGNDMVIVFDEDLQYGTDYAVAVTGAMDKNGMEYLPFTSTFRTRRENDNFPPEINLLQPEGGLRFVTGEPITLSAKATDEMGSISYVEFYANGEPIEGSRVTEGVDDVYSFEWIPTIDSLENTEITALACDNQGATVMSDKTFVVIASLRNPTINITSPENGSVYYKNLAGVATDTALTFNFETADEDNKIVAIEFFVDDLLVHTETEDVAITSFKLPEALEEGDHTITMTVWDESDLCASASVDVTVKVGGKRFPAVLDEDLTDSSMFARWDKSGNAKISYGSLDNFENIKGIVIDSQKPILEETSDISRNYKSALNSDPWQVDVSLAFGDDLSTRTVRIGSYDIATFLAGGEIIRGTSSLGKYVPGSVYTVSAVVNTDNGTLSCFLDGELVAEGVEAAASNFKGGAVISVTQIGPKGVSTQTAVTHAGIYKMTEAARSVSVKLYDKDGAEVEDMNSVPRDLSYVNVYVDGEVADSSTLANNVKIKNLSTGKIISLVYEGDKVKLNETLSSKADYRVIVGSSVRSTEGKSYSGAYSVEFTTEAEAFAVSSSDVKFKSGSTVLTSLPAAPCEITLSVPFINKNAELKSADIVCVAYEGLVAKQIATLTVEIPGNTTEPLSKAISMNLAEKFAAISDDTVIEAFVVNNLEELVPVSDSIFILK